MAREIIEGVKMTFSLFSLTLPNKAIEKSDCLLIKKRYRVNFTSLDPPHTPRVSIGMPVYNGEPFIREALDALLAQTFTDFELIISDNASTDRTEEICRQYAAKDRRIRYVRQEINRGAIANFQYVLDEAVGEYFMWAAADDLWADSFLQKLVPLVEIENIIIAFCGWMGIDKNNNRFPLPNQEYFKLDYSVSSSKSSRRSLIKYIFQNWSYGKVNIIYGLMKKSVLIDYNVLQKWGSFGFAGDHYIVMEILKQGDVKLCRDILFYKREHPNSVGALDANKTLNRTIYNIIKGVYRNIYLHYRYAINIWRPLSIEKSSMQYKIFTYLFTIFEILRITVFLSKLMSKAFTLKLYKSLKIYILKESKIKN